MPQQITALRFDRYTLARSRIKHEFYIVDTLSRNSITCRSWKEAEKLAGKMNRADRVVRKEVN